jgi:hypothetical protein
VDYDKAKQDRNFPTADLASLKRKRDEAEDGPNRYYQADNSAL